VLRPIENIFQSSKYPELLVGLDGPDDAAVWRLDEDRALVVTTDFFTPVVDDPYDYGAIAAANSLSDVYAMGGKPFLALNVAALPSDLDSGVVSEIMRGGAEKALEAGVVIAGGHTVQDQEPKYGLIVLGFVHPERMLTKRGARPGDILVISKPLGIGTTTTALKQGKAHPDAVAEAVEWMKLLNKQAAELAVEFGVRGGTDVTGFSLLGHGWEMAEASGVGLKFDFESVPFIRDAQENAAQFIFPGGSSDNRLYYSPHVRFAPEIHEASQMLLFDAQTSGGLLLAVPPDVLEDMLARAEEIGQALWVVGEVVEGNEIQVVYGINPGDEHPR
jgi:selenide,water dikinase